DNVDYFRRCYQGENTQHFDLKLRPNEHPELIKAVLTGENKSETVSVIALFIVIYRLRNNLFHGMKWAYKIRDQRSNFIHACNALIKALELDHPWGPF